MADLLTLDEYKEAVGLDPTDTRSDAKITQLLPWASLAVANYASRDFTSGAVTEERAFEYDGSGYLDIDDATAVTQVVMTGRGVPDVILDPLTWAAAPTRRDDAPVYFYIVMPGITAGYSWSPVMGFTANADVYAVEHGFATLPTMVKVTGTWGWASVPGDVKLATVWTIQDWVSKPTSDAVSSEAIEGYSRSWGGRAGGAGPSLAIPNRARDLLINYQKPV